MNTDGYEIEDAGALPLPPDGRRTRDVPAAYTSRSETLTARLCELPVGHALLLGYSWEASRPSSYLRVAQKKTGRRFTTRRLEDGRLGIWRVS